MRYSIMSVRGGKACYVGDVGSGGRFQYGLVPATDSRVLRYKSHDICLLAIFDIRHKFGGDFRIVDAPPRYSVWDRRLKRAEPLFSCNQRKQMCEWIIDGLRGTQGSERDHYVSCLLQLEDGKTQLFYDLDA